MRAKGLLVDWYAALIIASATRDLAQDPDAAALFLEDGQWPTISGWTALAEKRLDQARMADSLRADRPTRRARLLRRRLGAAMAADVQAKGGSLSRDDLAPTAPELDAALESPIAVHAFMSRPG